MSIKPVFTPTVVQGRGGGVDGGVDGTSFPEFLIFAVFRKHFAFSGKPSQQDEVILWVVTAPTMVAILDVILDFTKN